MSDTHTKGSIAKIRTMFDRIENGSTPISQSILTILACIGVRNILEDLSDNHLVAGKEIFADFYLQTTGFHISVFLTMSLVVMLLFRRNLSQSVRLLAVLAPLLFISPIADMIVSNWKGAMNMEYVDPGNWNELLKNYTTYFGPLTGKGVTFGQRTQIAVMIIGLMGYARIRGLSLVRTLLSGIVMYTIAFAYSVLPFLVGQAFALTRLEFSYSNPVAFKVYMLLIAIESIVVLLLGFPKEAKAFFKDLRYLRLLHIVFFFAIGWKLAHAGTSLPISSDMVLTICLASFAIFCAYVYSIVTNNIQDIGIDAITNAHRPHVTKAIDEKKYAALGWLTLVGAILYGGLAGHRVLILLGFFLANFYLYSMSPLRLKRLTLIGKGLMSLNFLTIMLIGFTLGGANVLDFPPLLIWWTVLAGMAIFNFVDLKDTAGDRKEGIKTLPVLFGDQVAKIIIGCFFLVGYAFAGTIVDSPWILLGATLLGVMQFALVMRKTYDERPHFTISLLAFILVFFFI